MEDAVEAVEFLARSPTRVLLLEALLENGRMERSALRSVAETSRTTLTRNLDSLEEQGWVLSENRTYAITPAGEAVVEDFGTLVETVTVASRLEEFFEWLPADEVDLDPRLLADADLYVPEPGDPYAMINKHVDRLERLEHLRLVLPKVGLHAAETGAEAIVEGGATAELVVTPEVAEAFQAEPYASLVEDMVATGRLEVAVYDGRVPFELAIIDDVVQIIGEEDGEPRALVESESEKALAWAERAFGEYQRAAVAVGDGEGNE